MGDGGAQNPPRLPPALLQRLTGITHITPSGAQPTTLGTGPDNPSFRGSCENSTKSPGWSRGLGLGEREMGPVKGERGARGGVRPAGSGEGLREGGFQML